MISEKIVVIDDDPRIIRSIKLIFTEYEILGFQDSGEAVAFLRRPNDINLVLLDVMMPGADGIGVLAEIKKCRPQICVVMMTAYGSMDIAVQALRHHADDFVEKPFNVDELRTKIRAHLKDKLPGNTPDIDRVERIKRYIRRNYSNISLQSIASEMSLSTRYVSRMFGRENDTGYRDYKVTVKVEVAQELLRTTSLTVEEISDRLGYLNPESFMRIFKQRTGVTPSMYREKSPGKKSVVR